jgi:hypothetical protein
MDKGFKVTFKKGELISEAQHAVKRVIGKVLAEVLTESQKTVPRDRGLLANSYKAEIKVGSHEIKGLLKYKKSYASVQDEKSLGHFGKPTTKSISRHGASVPLKVKRIKKSKRHGARYSRGYKDLVNRAALTHYPTHFLSDAYDKVVTKRLPQIKAEIKRLFTK